MFKRCLTLFLALLLVIGTFGGCAYNQGSGQSTQGETQNLNIMQKADPAQDDELNVLMIGNSFCYYYVEELYGLLTAAGHKNVNICNVYYSGCTLEQHWSWWKNGEANYDFYTTNEAGRNGLQGTNLEYCLKQRNWDIISLQEAGAKARESGAGHLTLTETYLTDLWGYLKEQFPMSRYFWHQTWSNQVGYDRNGETVDSLEQQEKENAKTREYALAVCEKYQLERVPTGDAWQIVRQGGYDNLCARLAVNYGEGDYYHDGDIGGAQYLNACVWFEAITGESCVGNTYKPDYALDENLIPTFQEAAHKAIEQLSAE